jgi:integrase
VKRQADGVRERRLSPDEYRALGKALVAAEGEGEAWQVIAGVRLLALTGARLDEIQGLLWSELDETSGCLRLGDSKEGKSVRPLGRAVFDVLREVPRDKSDFVLPGIRREGQFRSLANGVERIVRRARLDDVTAHTLRHSYASSAGDLGFSLPTISALLGHAAGGTTHRYIHQLDTVLVAAADRVACEIQRQMVGATAEIVRLPLAG